MGPILTYSGPGTCPVSVAQASEMLGPVSKLQGIKIVDSLEGVNNETRLIVFPGGHAGGMASKLKLTAEKVAKCIEEGVPCLGICAGPIVMSRSFITKAPIVKEQVNFHVTTLQYKGKACLASSCREDTLRFWPSSLYPGECIAPHVVHNTEATDSSNICAVGVNSVDEEGNVCSFQAPYFSGPAFLNVPETAKVLLRYQDPVDVEEVKFTYNSDTKVSKYEFTGNRVVDETPVAALSYFKGKGRVVLSGIHLEINPETYYHAAMKAGFIGPLPEELKTKINDTARKEFVEVVFRELGLK